MSDTTKIAVVGCGNVSIHRHLPILTSLKDVKVVAVADTNSANLDFAAETFNIDQRFTSYRDITGIREIDAVAICSPPATHHEIARECLRSGKHVFIEKPVTLSLSECDELIHLSHETGLKAMVGFKLRFHRLFQQAVSQVHNDDFGSVNMIRYVASSRYTGSEPDWLRCRNSGGGMLIEEGVHAFDFLRLVTRSEILEVSAITQDGELEDEIVTVTVSLTGGIQASVVLAKGSSEYHHIDLFCEKGRLEISRFQSDGITFFQSGCYPGSIKMRKRKLINLFTSLPQVVKSYFLGGANIICYRDQWKHFFSAIRYNTELSATLYDGREALSATLAAIASANYARPVKLTEILENDISKTTMVTTATPKLPGG